MEAPWLDLINSYWIDYRGSGKTKENLEDDDWMRAFLGWWPWVAGPAGFEPELTSELRDLRAAIRRVVEILVAGSQIPDDYWAPLNAALASAPLVYRLEHKDGNFELDLLPASQSRKTILADIALSFADTLANGEPDRIKICANEDCPWVFYDHSKNRTRRWCDPDCGNLIKVRRFRARRKQGSVGDEKSAAQQ